MALSIETRNLHRRLSSDFSLKSINLKVRQSSIYGLVGPNGAGKSTLINVVLGIETIDAGDVFIEGCSFREDRLKSLKKIGAVVDNLGLYEHLTAFENLKISCLLLNVPPSQAAGLLKMVGLSHCPDKKVKNFSLGMKQRLAIATALVGNPSILVLDEPTNGLDPIMVADLKSIIRSLPQLGVSTLISSHILSDIEELSDDIGILRDGQLIFQGTKESLLDVETIRLEISVDNTEKARDLLVEEGYRVAEKEGNVDVLYVEADAQEHREISTLLFRAGLTVYEMTKVTRSIEQTITEALVQ